MSEKTCVTSVLVCIACLHYVILKRLSEKTWLTEEKEHVSYVEGKHSLR